MDITYQATKGNKVRFERINITGNTTTRDKVIRRELEVYEGEYFSGLGNEEKHGEPAIASVFSKMWKSRPKKAVPMT